MDDRSTHPRAREATPDTWRSPGPRRRERLSLLAALLASAILAGLVVAWLGPPAVVPASAAPEQFSAARARVHLERITRVPHPVGSAAAREVEAYVTQTLQTLGWSVESMAGPACTEGAGLHRCANVRNVIATLPGRTREPALLLSAHYDSVPNAPGAGDDGAAVAALLEVARALGAGPKPERDVVLAFLDGEEELMLGAAAFCHAAGSRRIGLVANFDARGNRGAATLVGASPDSSGQLAALLGGLSHPIVNSFYPSVASVLPNATDAEIYERCGFPALSFAFADGFESYHQGTDSAERLDLRSLQHHGSYALDVARSALESRPLAPPRATGLVFFDVAGVLVVRYSFTLARVLGATLVIAAVVALARRVRAGTLGARRLGGAVAACVAALIGVGALGAGVVQLVSWGWRQWRDYVHAPALAGCAACATVAVLMLLVGLAVRRGRDDVPHFGPVLVWVLLAGLCAAVAPGLSHLFTWPAAALLVASLLPARALAGRALARGVASLLAVLLLTPVTYALVVVVGAPGVVGAMVCLGLFVGIWAAPLAELVARPGRLSGLLFAACAVGAVALRLSVAMQAGPPVGNTLGYALDAGAQQARWVSADTRMDDWKALLLGSEPARARLPAFWSERPLLWHDAPPVALEPPRLELLSDGWGSDGRRTLVLQVRSPRAARNLLVWEARGVQFTRLRFDGTEPIPLVRFAPELDRWLFRLLSGMDDAGLWSVSLFAPNPDGDVLELSTEHAGELELRCSDRSEGLAFPTGGAPPRGPGWTEGYAGDYTLVSAPVLRLAALPPR